MTGLLRYLRRNLSLVVGSGLLLFLVAFVVIGHFVVDVEDDPDKPGEQRITFRAIEGIRAPSAVELAGAGAGEAGAEPTNGE